MNFLSSDIAKSMGAATVGIRPEHVTVGNGGGAITGTVKLAEHLGSDTFLHIDVPKSGILNVRVAGQHEAGPGSPISLKFDPAKMHRFDEKGISLDA
jgi:multiple sugar transport system ATP-binding protein